MPKAKEYIRLTHNFVRSVATEGRYGDGRGGLGLSLLVKKTASGRWSRTWSQRIRIGGKLAMLGLGSFPSVTLAMARDKALDNARRVESGEDIRKPPPTVPTVDEAFDRVIKGREKSWKRQSEPREVAPDEGALQAARLHGRIRRHAERHSRSHHPAVA